MTRLVHWAGTARTDLTHQIDYIASDNPDAAAHVSALILKTADALGDFATGHPGRVSGTYEKSVRGLPYVIAYSLSEGDAVIFILRVIHTARDWPEEGWPEN